MAEGKSNVRIFAFFATSNGRGGNSLQLKRFSNPVGSQPVRKNQALEQAFCQLTGNQHAIAVSSATAGMHITLMALEIGKGDEVITPSPDRVSTLNMISLLGYNAGNGGCRPRYADGHAWKRSSQP